MNKAKRNIKVMSFIVSGANYFVSVIDEDSDNITVNNMINIVIFPTETGPLLKLHASLPVREVNAILKQEKVINKNDIFIYRFSDLSMKDNSLLAQYIEITTGICIPQNSINSLSN